MNGKKVAADLVSPGGHNHVSWQDDNYRKIMLNAILWTAGMQVPEKAGCIHPPPDDEEIESNLDPVIKKKKKS
jgi:type 1 glutamine amidotransferase